MPRRLATILALLAVAALARLAAWPLGSFDGRVREVVIEGAEKKRVVASVYEPDRAAATAAAHATGAASGATGTGSPAGAASPATGAAAPATGAPPATLATGTDAHRPAVVLCHGVHASRRHMDPLARALARRGLLVVTFDYGGEGDSEPRSQTEDGNIADVRAAIALARASGAGGPIALVGHSMGVTSAIGAALVDPGVACVVALGQRPFGSPDRPRALLAAAGAMDAFHPYGALVNAASESAGRPIAAFETAVDPKSGAVRRVVFAASCEHAGEVYDGVILGHAVGFIEAAFAAAHGSPAHASASSGSTRTSAAGASTEPPSSPASAGGAAQPATDAYADAPLLLRPPLEASLLFVARLALAAAVALLGLALGSIFGIAGPSATGAGDGASGTGASNATGSAAVGRLGGIARRVLSLALLLVALAPLLGVRAGAISLDLARDAAPALLGGAAIANMIVRRRALGIRIDPRSSVATGLALYAGWIGGTSLGALAAFRAHPDLLLGLPIYLWQGVALRVHFSLETLATSLVPASLAGAAGVLGAAVGGPGDAGALGGAGGSLDAAAASAAASAGASAGAGSGGGLVGAVLGLLSDAPWTLAIIVVAEIVAPGRALGFLVNLALRIVRALGGPVTIPAGTAGGLASDAGAAAARAVALSRAKLAAILLGLLAVAGLLFWKRAGEGLLAGDGALGTVAMAGIRLLVLPALAAWLGVLGLKLVEKVRGRPIGG